MTMLEPERTLDRQQDGGLTRWLPLAGLAYAVLTLVGDFVVDKFPDGDTSTEALSRYYAAHHSQVGTGGQIMGIAVVFLGLFVAGLVIRTRQSLGTAALIGVGGAAYVAAQEWSAAVYAQLGSIGGMRGVSPEALQAWHTAGAEWTGVGSASLLFALGIGIAGLVDRTVPAWIAVVAVVLAAASFAPQPFGFFASMLMLVWAAVAGVTLAVRR
jgi:hypothetical protein